MLIRFLKKFWLLLIASATILTGLQVGLDIFPKFFRFSLNFLNKMHHILCRPLSITTNIFVLIALSLLFLTLLLLYFINYFKNKINIPKKDMIGFLLLYKDNKEIYIKNLYKISPYSKDKTNLYFDKLRINGFLEKAQANNINEMVDNLQGAYNYKLSHKGLLYLDNNKLLD